MNEGRFIKLTVFIQKEIKALDVSRAAMKCEICKNKIQETFLKKLVGTHIKDAKGKKHVICFECQKKFHDKQAMLKQLGKE